jgi:hypothetical protein
MFSQTLPSHSVQLNTLLQEQLEENFWYQRDGQLLMAVRLHKKTNTDIDLKT